MKKLICVILTLLLILAVPFGVSAKDQYQNNTHERAVLHDPSVVRGNDGAYYAVGSHLAMYKSADLINWKSLGYSMEGNNYLTPAGGSWKETLAEPLGWCLRYQRAVPERYNEDNFEYNCWANDIIYNKTMKKYCLYGCCSVWGTTASAIWLCVSDNITGPYTYVDTLICSGITSTVRNGGADPVLEALDWKNSNYKWLVDNYYVKKSFVETDEYFPRWMSWDGYYACWWGMYPNAIDPTVFEDKDGEYWLVYGSFSGGCYLYKLDKTTGLRDFKYMRRYLNSGNTSPNDDIYFGKQISRTNPDTEGTGEGPFIVYDKVSGYYYFYLTYGGLAADGGYNIREYRSKSPEGPYLDAAGNDAMDIKNTGLKLDGNYRFSCQPTAFLSGGHSSCLVDTDGSMYQVYHTRFTADNGYGHQMRVHKMVRTRDGWSVMLPFEYQGETYTKRVWPSYVIGEYELIDSNNMTQRKENASSPWSDIVLPTQKIQLNPDGTVTGAKDYACSITKANTGAKAVKGTWSLTENSAYATIKLGGVTYQCVFCYQKDESDRMKNVMTFAGAGNDNSTLWGVQYKAYKLPVKTSVTKTYPAKKAFKVKWKSVIGIKGYQLQYSTNKSFKKKKTVTVKSAKTTVKTVKKLKAKKRYYIRVRTYKTINGKRYYSDWSAKKSVKTK